MYSTGRPSSFVHLHLTVQSRLNLAEMFRAFSPTHTATVSDDAGLSLISLFNQSRGSPSQQYFPVGVNLINKQRDDKTGQESGLALPRLLPVLILSPSSFPFISRFSCCSLWIFLSFCFNAPALCLSFCLGLSIWLMRNKDCNLMLKRCWEIIPRIVFPWQTSPSVYVVVSLVCIRVCVCASFAGVYISFLSQCVICVFVFACRMCSYLTVSVCVLVCQAICSLSGLVLTPRALSSS